jgi:hypothetical protein
MSAASENNSAVLEVSPDSQHASNNEKQHPRECAVSFATQCRIGLEYL